MRVVQLTALSDNYIHLITNDDTHDCIIVDASEAAPVIQYCESNNLNPRFILCTHHHWDHVGGNLELQKRYGCQIIGSKLDQNRIPGAQRFVDDGEELSILGLRFKVLSCPGHTIGAVTYLLAGTPSVAFTGDTLFTMGCGKLFEGTPEQMWLSLNKLKENLPPDTLIYCGHEYTMKNTAFARKIKPSEALNRKWELVLKSHNSQKSTVPGLISEEILLNPFLNARNAAEFAQIRALRDQFQLEPPTALG